MEEVTHKNLAESLKRVSIFFSSIQFSDQTTHSNSNNNNVPAESTQTNVLTKSKPQVSEPSLYRVILLNDDYTPMEFVVYILRQFFHKSEPEATRIMMQVHREGLGVAGIFSYEIAETKVYIVNEHSRKNQHPLKCIMEKNEKEIKT